MDNCEIVPIRLKAVYAFLIKGQKNIIVDCGIPGSCDSILKAMSKHGVKKDALSLILITHGHSDHMGSASDLRRATGAKTAVHRFDADVIRTGKNPRLHPTSRKGKIFGGFIGEAIDGFTPYEPEIIIDGEQSLSDYGIPGRVITTPGHTDGSISVILDNGSAVVGDALMGGMVTRGKPNFPLYADSTVKAYDSIKKIIGLSPQKIYTGHGGPFTLNEVKRNFKGL